MENRALGKGLSALIPERQKDAAENAAHVKTSRIKDNSLQPRADFDRAQLDSLIASIKEKGVLQPILVRRRGDGFEVIAGERRLRAARELHMEEVPVVIRDVDDKEALVLALVENIQREELNPIEEAHAFKRLIEEFNFTQDDIAQSVSKDRSTIGNIVRLLKLPAEIQKSVADGLLTFGHARALLGIENQSALMHAYLEIIKKDLSVRELEGIIKRTNKHVPKRRTGSAGENPYIIDIQEDMQRLLGTKVRIKSRKKRGMIEIEFYSPADLERIWDMMKR